MAKTRLFLENDLQMPAEPTLKLVFLKMVNEGHASCRVLVYYQVFVLVQQDMVFSLIIAA